MKQILLDVALKGHELVYRGLRQRVGYATKSDENK